MQIGVLAKESGVSVPALRFYERLGLLQKPARTEAGYQQYGPNDLRRLQLIRQAKRLGFSLDEIRRILRLRQQGSCPCDKVIGSSTIICRRPMNRSRSYGVFERRLRERLMTGSMRVQKGFPARSFAN